MARLDILKPSIAGAGIPAPLQDVVASVVSLIKVEAKFNPKKVGDGVHVAMIERQARRAHTAIF